MDIFVGTTIRYNRYVGKITKIDGKQATASWCDHPATSEYRTEYPGTELRQTTDGTWWACAREIYLNIEGQIISDQALHYKSMEMIIAGTKQPRMYKGDWLMLIVV